MASSAMIAGLGVAVAGFSGRALVRAAPGMTTKLTELGKLLPKINVDSILGSKYYKGGFDSKMSKREASLILGVSQTATKSKVNDAYRRIMMSNHPDQGGSKYLASKVSEARTFLLNRFK